MNILHTSDWHIGRKLYNRDMDELHRRFFEWLINQISTHKVEALLVSGDIFDTGYPSNAALELYYRFLTHLQDTPCRQVIITGGNHDSVSTLEAPRQVLQYLNVYVIGGASQNPDELLLPLYNSQGRQAAWVAAVPFLRDRDIRKTLARETYEERVQMIKAGIVRFYQNLADRIAEINTDFLPVIAMGHLFMTGATTSDTERDIHIGNLGHVEAAHLPATADYWALGHIHRPQQVADNPFIRYPGSPLQLSFSERTQKKQVLLAAVENNEITPPRALEVPVFKELIRFKGSFEEVTRQINQWQSSGDTPAWADVEITEEKQDPAMVRQVQEFISHSQDPEVLSFKVQFNDVTGGADELYADTRTLADLSAREVFEKKLDNNALDEIKKNNLLKAFDELMHQLDDLNE